MNQFEYVILGGGVAGLCAAKRLLELGFQPLIIEAGGYPSHKVCGEFFSPSSLPILKKWNFHPILISKVQLHTFSQNLNLNFSNSAGSLSHLTFDLQLSNQISEQGAILLTQTKVTDLLPTTHEDGSHRLTLSTGEEIKAKHLLIATGRVPRYSLTNFKPYYMGFKAHFSGIELNSTLHMFSFKDAYLGIVPIENKHANLACLAKLKKVLQFPSPQQFIQSLVTSHPFLFHLLSSGYNLFNNWMEVYVPEFGLRNTPNWPQTYWIGDAAMTIPPASGNGLSLAIVSGCLAAEFAIRNDPVGFKHFWKKRCILQMKFAKGLHYLFLNPSWSSIAIHLNDWLPSLAPKVFNFTRDPGL